MKVLLTGISSFTGFWFATALSVAGHEVVGCLTRTDKFEYDGLARLRLDSLLSQITLLPNAAIGEDTFLNEISQGTPDVVCLHGAWVGDHRSADFPVMEALAHNTKNCAKLFQTCRNSGVRSIIATGSYFEADSGLGVEPRMAFSPYALSKTLTWQIYQYHAHKVGLPIAKFVLANPFGRMEKPGMSQYFAKAWLAGEKPECRTPGYVRDNVPVDLLGLVYARFVEQSLSADGRPMTINPSGYVETVADFLTRYSSEMRKRWNFPCEYILANKPQYDEPMVRANNHSVLNAYDWNEETFWDELAEYYLRTSNF